MSKNNQKDKFTEGVDNVATEPTEPSEPKVKTWEVSEVLRVQKPPVANDEVKSLQDALISKGFHCGTDSVTGVFTKDTAVAVRQFQGMNGLFVNGVVGKEVVEKLGGIWKGKGV